MQEKKYKLYQGDCHKIASTLYEQVELIIADPPYPDYYKDEYKYYDDILKFFNEFSCRQFIFWTAKVDFPLSYTAIHIWDKKTGAGSEYERIFERNGSKNYKVFRHYFINSTVAASFTGDVFTGHPSQKPKQLLLDIMEYDSRKNMVIFDPFMGSGSTGVAAMQLGHKFIGCEINPKYFDIAQKRIYEASLQMPMFTEQPNRKKLDKTESMF